MIFIWRFWHIDRFSLEYTCKTGEQLRPTPDHSVPSQLSSVCIFCYETFQNKTFKNDWLADTCYTNDFISGTHSVKSELLVTFNQQFPDLSSQINSILKKCLDFVLIYTCIKQSLAFSSKFLCFLCLAA